MDAITSSDLASPIGLPRSPSTPSTCRGCLFDEDRSVISANKRGRFRWMARKRRRRRSRSVSERSSYRSGTRRTCCSVGASAAYGTCSDFPVAVGTDSSGELFGNGDASWASDASEAARNLRRESDGGSGERESLGVAAGLGLMGNLDNQGNDSGYGSEPGYRGDAEFGYGDEVDEEEDDQRILFWGQKRGEIYSMVAGHTSYKPGPQLRDFEYCQTRFIG